MLEIARYLGYMQEVTRITAILAIAEGLTCSKVAAMLSVSKEAVRLWIRAFLLGGPDTLRSKKSL